MRVYVDAAIHPWRGQKWCHLFAPDIDDLHQFARRIGMRAEWFQDPRTMRSVSWPHYDLNERRRSAAISAGAVSLGRHQTIAMSRIILNRYFALDGTEHVLDPLERYRRTNSPLGPRLEAWLIAELGAGALPAFISSAA